MSAFELTFDETVRMAKEIVEGRPEGFRYQDAYGDFCQYAIRNSASTDEAPTFRPACLVGQILDKAGFDLARFDERVYSETLNGVTVESLFEKEIIGGDYRTRSFMSLLQTHQDMGDTWAEALSMAIRNC